MASQLNLLLHTYPKLRSSTPFSTMKTTSHGSSGSMELPFLMINQRCRSSWSSFQIQTRRRKMISPRLIAACSISEAATTTTTVVPAAVAVAVPPSSWVETYIPEKARPYAYLMRLHKFTAGPLITMPCLWSIAFTIQPGNIGDAKMLALFLLVGIVNRGILCTINDILDQDFDAKFQGKQSSSSIVTSMANSGRLETTAAADLSSENSCDFSHLRRVPIKDLMFICY